MYKLATVVLAVAALVMPACDDDDEVVSEALAANLTLTAAEETPACAAAGATATGSGTVTLSSDRSTITVDNLTFSGLSGPATGAHIHFGAVGVAGPIVFPLGTTSPINATFTASDYPAPPPTGVPADFAAFAEQLRTGMTYVNIHTTACPGGEIRAQIE